MGGRRFKDYHTTDERIEQYTDPMHDFLTSQIALLAIFGVLIMCDILKIALLAIFGVLIMCDILKI